MTNRILMTAATTALLIVGGALSANASVATTSISDWTTGTVGSYRTASSTNATQSILLKGCVANSTGPNSPSIGVKDVQMQLQKDSGNPVPTSYGNMTKACGTAMAWGSGLSGRFRYQLNSIHSSDGTYYGNGGFLFSASPVTINY